VLDHDGQDAGARGAGRRPLDQSDDDGAVVGPVDQAGGQVGGDERAGNERPPQLLEDQRRLGQAQTDTAGLVGQAQQPRRGGRFLPLFLSLFL